MTRARRWLVLSILVALWPLTLAARDPQQLDILQDQYPRAFFFRATEGAYSVRRYPTFESWARHFDRLQGIMGKCLEEECQGREPRNPLFFTRFKKEHPRQVVLLHFNGNARDPRYHAEKYFPGHWIYRRAVMITQDVPAESGETVIHVNDASDFRVNTGRYRTSNDDIALFGMTDDGKHDWYHCEQVQLLAVDPRAKTITVRRGCYGTEPLAFTAGRSRAAAHMTEGPWGANNHLMWFYNFATHCPRDRDGKSCADLLVDDLAQWFGPDGPLAAFDGLEFDVMHHQTHGDTDGDGVEDHGIVDGINQYGIGMVEFARQLRQRVGDDFIIQGDGALGPGGSRSQRAWGILNGIESEGWPNLTDWDMEDWSGGMNRHFFWQANARPPAFNYVNHKWNQSVPGEPGVRVAPKVDFGRHRLVLAACQFFDAATCYSFAPPADPGGLFGIWDELRRGVDGQPGWLGGPDGPPIRLAANRPDLMREFRSPEALARRITGNVRVQTTSDGLQVSSADPNAKQLEFVIRDVPAQGADLTVFVTMSADPMKGYPREVARFAQVAASGGMIDLLSGRPLATGMKLRGDDREVPIDRAEGATVQARRQSIAGKTLPAIFMHPPYKSRKGYAFWTTEATVPENGELRFFIGMGEKSPERSDGVLFEVYAAEVAGDGTGPYRRLFSELTNRHQWLPRTVALDEFAGKRVRLKFVADCGPNDNATTDHAHWGDVKIVRSDLGEDRITPSRSYMTWVNDRPFTSSFYYRHIRSPSVDLTFSIEGSEPVRLQAITAHAHPDAVCRVFEKGIVLANPSYEPYTFNLEELSPDRSYRRLQGTRTQDPVTNNGQPVGNTVTLGEREGLFLVRVK